MREQFGPRGEFYVYILIETIIKAICYRLSMVSFVLASAYHWGLHFDRMVAFSRF